MYRSILVPLNGLATGEHALPFSLALARETGATVHMVYLHEARLPEPYLDGFTPFLLEGVEEADHRWEQDVREQEQEYLEELVQRLPLDGPEVTTALLEVPTIGTLQRHAQERGADLIAVAVHAGSKPADGWLDAVADGLVHGARTPLLLVPAGVEVAEAKGVVFQQVLIPLDGSAFAEQVIDHALALDPQRRARYTLLKVLPMARRSNGDRFSAYGIRVADSDLMRRQALARGYLAELGDRLRARGFCVKSRLLVQPDPGAAILDVAQETGADLIAMATHGRGGLTKLLLGSVAEEVLHGTSKPLLLYRPTAVNR